MKKLIAFTATILLSTQIMAATPALSCFGTEPFWGLTTTEKTVLIENFGDEAESFDITSVGPAAGTANGYSTLISAVNKKRNLKLITKREECNDGMSERVYKYSASVIIGDSLIIGCCNDK